MIQRGYRLLWIWVFMICATASYSQDSIPPSWTYSAAGMIRCATVTGTSIAIGVDSTVMIIDRSTGIETSRFITHDGVIEGVHLQPDHATCIVVSAAYDTASGKVLNTVVEYAVPSGTELRRVQLNIVANLCWEPNKVKTLCAFSGNGRYLYTSSMMYRYCNEGLITGGSGQRLDLSTFQVDQSYGGGWGSIATSQDGRLLMINGTSGYLDTNPKYGGWKSSTTTRIRIPSDTGYVWHFRDNTNMQLSPNERFFYDRTNIYDTVNLHAIPNNDLLTSSYLSGICTNAKNYFTWPNVPNKDHATITIYDLISNTVRHELIFDSEAAPNARGLVYNDDTTFIALFHDRLISWSVNLESEFPPRLARLIGDTISTMTWYPAVPRTLPLGVTYQASVFSSTLHVGKNMAIAQTAGDHMIGCTLIGTSSDTTTASLTVHAIERSFDPRARWGIAATSVNSVLRVSIDASGRYLGSANGSCLLFGDRLTNDVEGTYHLNELECQGVIASPEGTIYSCRDSLISISDGPRGYFVHRRELQFEGLLSSGESTPVRLLRYEHSSDVGAHQTPSSRWDPEYHWMYLIRFSPQGGGSGLMMSTVFDGADGINVPSSAFYGSQPLSFDRDPRTGELHWIAHPKNVPSYAAYDKFFRYVQHANGTCDSVSIPTYRTLAFVAGGAYILSSGVIYNRLWQRVGPDTNRALFTGPFLGSRPYAVDAVAKTNTASAYLRIRRVPDGRTVDSILFDKNIVDFSTDSAGRVIALSFSDTTVQVFLIDSLVPNLTHTIKDPGDPNSIDLGPDTRYITDTARPVIPGWTNVVKLPPNTVRVAPHPVTDHAEITFDLWTSVPLTLTIRDMQGHVVYHATVPVNTNVILWYRRDNAAQRLSSGMYALSITDGFTIRRSLILVE